MSDPVTNIDIEDVLSSIRRLVSEGGSLYATNSASASNDGHDAATTMSVPSQIAQPGPDVPAPGRFVLTPALRVVDAVPAPAPPTSGPLPMDILPHADVLLALSDTDPTATDGFDFDTSDFEVVDTTTTTTTTDAANLPAAPEHVPDVAAPASPDRKLRLADTAAGFEVAVTGQRDTWEPDGSENIPVMDWSRTAPEDGPIFRSRHLGPLRLEQYARTAPPTLPPDEALTFRHTPIVAPEVAVGKSSTVKDLTDDDFGDDPDGVARFEAEAVTGVDDDLAAYIAHSGAIDEDLLRKLVIEIVHQELQGTLGERITRNVRKLVRREIQRALSSTEYD